MSCQEGEHLSRRSLGEAQPKSGVPQKTELHRKPELVAGTALAQHKIKVILAQGIALGDQVFLPRDTEHELAFILRTPAKEEGSAVTRSHTSSTVIRIDPVRVFQIVEPSGTSVADETNVEASFGSGSITILASIGQGRVLGPRDMIGQPLWEPAQTVMLARAS